MIDFIGFLLFLSTERPGNISFSATIGTTVTNDLAPNREE
jgi:hypothetical protein